jgi:AAA+ ATPase superfamily predicted ATPase
LKKKPKALFDRDWEWGELTRFAEDKRSGAALGIVSGRRRQGKSWLLHALAESTGGFYYEAIEGSEGEILRDLGVKLASFTRAPAPFGFSSMEQALAALFELGTNGQNATVVLDEFPVLAGANPAAPSILRNLLGPGGGQRNRSRTRLLLCGSALHFMGGLLAGQSPLRGRAGLELIVPSFDFRTARQFWRIRDLALAVKVFAIVGGTPAYRREFVADDVPRGPSDFDAWVARTALSPAVPLFREARYLLAEDPAIGDLGLYHSVLSAIAFGETTSAKIAGRLGRPATALAHPLNVLADAGFVAREQDPFHEKRIHYAITEPIVTFHHAILRPAWSDLERPGRAAEVWKRSKPTFEAQVLGPAFESLCRTWARHFAEPDTFGGPVRSVARALVPDAGERRTHEVDVVVMGDDDRILALGEAKWAKAIADADLERLRRIASLLSTRGHDTRGTRFALFSGTGFSPAFRSRTEAEGCVLIDLKRLYGVG